MDHKNRKAWPLLVLKIIIELLVNGTLPIAVYRNLESTCRIICYNIIIKELLNIDYICKIQGVICILCKIIAIYRLDKKNGGSYFEMKHQDEQ